MAKDPAFLFYSSDFLSGTIDLTFEEKGQYITLLCIQHQKGRLSSKAVAIAVPNATADVMAKFSIDENGMYYNERLEIEAEKRAKHSDKQRQRAIDGWKKRKATADATALPLENENENRNENKDINKKKEQILFSNFIQNFNEITGKKIRVADKKFKGQFKARLKEGFTMQEILTAVENCSKDNYHIQNPRFLTPEFITRSDKLQKYLSNGNNKPEEKRIKRSDWNIITSD